MSRKKVLATVGIIAGVGAGLGVLAYIIHKNVFFGGRDKYGIGDVDAWRNGFGCPCRFCDDDDDFDDFDDLDDLDEEDEDSETESLDFDDEGYEDCL